MNKELQQIREATIIAEQQEYFRANNKEFVTHTKEEVQTILSNASYKLDEIVRNYNK